jgi:hypothetical protein
VTGLLDWWEQSLAPGSAWAIAIVVRPFQLRLSCPVIPLAGAVAWGVGLTLRDDL